MDKTHATRISNTFFFKNKYLTNPTISLADSILAAAVNMAAQLHGHHTLHLGADQLRDLNNLHTIFVNATTTNTADAPTPTKIQTSGFCVLAPRAGDAKGANLDTVSTLPSISCPVFAPASPPRAIPISRATPLQVSPFPRVDQNHLLAQAPDTTPHQRVPTTPTASRQEPLQRSPRSMNASSTVAPPTMTPQRRPTRLVSLRDNLAERDEQNASQRLLGAQLPLTEQLEGPDMHTQRRTYANLNTHP